MRQVTGRGNPVVAEVRHGDLAEWVPVRDRGSAELPVRVRQEHHAKIGDAAHDQLGGALEKLITITGGSEVTGSQQERNPFACSLHLVVCGLLPSQQLGAFLLGALRGGQVDDVGGPAQWVAAGHCRSNEDRHAVPVPVHVLSLEWAANSELPQLCYGVVLPVSPLRRGDIPPRDSSGIQVMPGVADDFEVGVVGLVDPLLVGDHHAEHVRCAQPTHQLDAFTESRLRPALLGQVLDYRVCPLRPTVLVRRLGNRGDQQPPQLAGLAMRCAHQHVGDHLAGAQRHRDRQLLGAERRAVLAHRMPSWRRGPREHIARVDADHLARCLVRRRDQPVGGVVDNAQR